MEEIGEKCDHAPEVVPQPEALVGKRGRWRDGAFWRTWRFWQWPVLVAIAAVAAVADAWDITSDGLEVYYAAGRAEHGRQLARLPL
jgi:hypothetical protein